MSDKIYVAYSRAQDECTLNNRWFETYAEAWAYAQLVEKNSGCLLDVIAISKGTAKDMAE